MAQHLLQTAQIGAVIEKMCRKGMAQHVGRDISVVDACF
jgi:hypothetical protein